MGTTIHTNRTGRLIDSTKQIEVLFDPKRNPLCKDHPNSYAVIGIPDTHIVFEENIEKLFMTKQVNKPRRPPQTSITKLCPTKKCIRMGTYSTVRSNIYQQRLRLLNIQQRNKFRTTNMAKDLRDLD